MTSNRSLITDSGSHIHNISHIDTVSHPSSSQPSNDPLAADSRSQINDSQSGEAGLDVAVIIVTYNSEEQIEACLNSVLQQRERIKQEIIVVDNQSRDGTVEIIRDKFPQVRLFTPAANLGFAKGVNFAAKQTDAAYLLLLNPDTVVLDHAIDRVHSFAQENPEYGFYGGRTLKEDGVSLERSSCWGQPTVWSLFLFATGLSTLLRHNSFFDPESLGGWKRDSVREVGVITGCFLLVERAAWEAIDGFDEHFWLYGEDVDLAMRARKAGYRPVIFPGAVTIHEVGQSSTSAQKKIWLYRGKVSLIKKHWSGLKRSLALFFLKFGVFIRSVGYRLRGRRDNAWVVGWDKRSEWTDGHPVRESDAEA